MWRRPACQTLSKPVDTSSATARVAPDLWKALAILSDTTVRKSAIDQEGFSQLRNDTEVMPILILIDVQYSQNAVFSLDKGLNCQNHSSSGSHPLGKKILWDICWYRLKKWFLWAMAAAQAAENHGDVWVFPDTYCEAYTHQFQPEPTHKIH